MKLPLALIPAAFASVAVTNVVAEATPATASSPTPTIRLEGHRPSFPLWNSRIRRRELSPATPVPTAVIRRRDGPASGSTTAGDSRAPWPPNKSDIWEVFDPFPVIFSSQALTGSISASASSTTVKDGTSKSAAPTSTDMFEIIEPFPVSESNSATAPSATSIPSGLPAPANDTLWEDAANHGCRLVDAMRVSDHDAGQLYSPIKDSVQSTLTNFDDFTSWGWNANELNGSNFTDIDGGQKQPDPGWGIGHALRELGVSDKIKGQGGKNVVIDAIHGKEPFTQSYIKNGKTYPATGAEFKIGINTDDGVLMAVDRISPASAAKKRSPPVSDSELPDVHTFSDLGYLNYKKILGTDPKSLKYMMSLMITNDETASIITKALNGKSLGPWPGETFSWRTKAFKALLGSPNGMGFGYLLVQHKSQLGNMFIKEVRVFHGDTWHHLLNMVFVLEEQNGQDPPPKPSGSPPQMEEPAMTAAAGNLRRGDATRAETKITVQGEKNYVRAHIKHMEL